MPTRLQTPPGTTEISIEGERYHPDENGVVSVPDIHADTLRMSHGFAFEGQRPKVIIPGADDGDSIIEDDNDAPSPSDFSRPMSQQQMKQYLRSEGVGIPKNGTVADLRAVVEKTYAARLEAGAQADVKKDDGSTIKKIETPEGKPVANNGTVTNDGTLAPSTSTNKS